MLQSRIVKLKKGGGIICPVCGSDNWCAFILPDSILCMRVSDGCAKRRDGTEIKSKYGGYIHRIKGKNAREMQKTILACPSHKWNARLTRSEIEIILKQHKAAINPSRLKNLSENLGLSVESLKIWDIGFDCDTALWSFPMRDEYRMPIGVRLRGQTDGLTPARQMCISGSRNGVFFPNDLDETDKYADSMVLFTEGPTDGAAATDLGFRAIGRPSNSGGVDILRKYLAFQQPQTIVVVADNDGPRFIKNVSSGKVERVLFPGIEGAVSLAEAIVPLCEKLRFLLPPEGIKDLRDWKKSIDFMGAWSAIANASIVTPKWIISARKRLEEKKSELTKRKDSLKCA